MTSRETAEERKKSCSLVPLSPCFWTRAHIAVLLPDDKEGPGSCRAPELLETRQEGGCQDKISQLWLYVRGHASCFAWITSFNPPNSPKKWLLLLSPIYRMEKLRLKRWNDFCQLGLWTSWWWDVIFLSLNPMLSRLPGHPILQMCKQNHLTWALCFAKFASS